MNVDVQPGTYVVAVSGGVDSMVLLDILLTRSDLKLIVAHFDHGIRQDSVYDRQLVQQVAAEAGVKFVYHEGKLGSDASEDAARVARYKFLHAVRKGSGAAAIITAHHRDDALETAVINLLRGTNRTGLTALRSRQYLLRPLLHVSKRDIKQYAKDRNIIWREDSTNTNPKYLRNNVRHTIIPRLTESQQAQFHAIIASLRVTNDLLDQEIAKYLQVQPASHQIDRASFVQLPHSVAREVMLAWLRQNGVTDIDSKILERAVVAAKTFRVGGIIQITGGYTVTITKTILALDRPDR